MNLFPHYSERELLSQNLIQTHPIPNIEISADEQAITSTKHHHQQMTMNSMLPCVSQSTASSSSDNLAPLTKKSRNKRYCANCDSLFPIYECLDCPVKFLQRLYCSECSQLHVRIKVTRGHRIQALPQPKWPRHKLCVSPI